MILKIPLTLAIIDGIVMEVGTSSFVIETGAVKEFVSVTESMMIHEPGGEEYVMIRGEAYPVIRVGEWYHMRDFKTNVEEGMMVIIEAEKKEVCLFVDKLVGKQEIVVKPIPEYIRKVKGLTGCTQLGDGSIALILDAAGFIE
jgi:two-component system chemotaxis sensor kinase CheA